MDIYYLRKDLGMTQKAFAAKLGIPISTIRNWEQGASRPPEYVLNLIEDKFKASDASKEMISKDVLFELMEAIHAIEALAVASSAGIAGWEDVTSNNANSMLYFSRYTMDEDGNFAVVKRFAEDPYGIIRPVEYWGMDSDCYSVYAHEDLDSGEPEAFIIVTLKRSGKKILIENGGWMFTDGDDRIVVVTSDITEDNRIYDPNGSSL